MNDYTGECIEHAYSNTPCLSVCDVLLLTIDDVALLRTHERASTRLSLLDLVYRGETLFTRNIDQGESKGEINWLLDPWHML